MEENCPIPPTYSIGKAILIAIRGVLIIPKSRLATEAKAEFTRGK